MRMSDEERKNYEFAGTVKDMPKNFTDWVEKNEERIARAKSVPEYIKESKHVFYNQYSNFQKNTSLLPSGERIQIESIIKESASPVQIKNSLSAIECNISQSLKEYARTFAEGGRGYYESSVIAMMMNELEREDEPFRRIILINRIKEKCAVKMRWELRRRDYTYGLEYVGMSKNYKISEDAVYVSSKGEKESITANLIDIITYKDKNGIKYSYVIGDTLRRVNNAGKISKQVVGSLPVYAKKNFNGILLTEQLHPMDAYWKKQFQGSGYDFEYGAMYSGEPISVHQKYHSLHGNNHIDEPQTSFRTDLLHEIGHHIQSRVDLNAYREAVKLDGNYFRSYSETAITKHNNNNEDIADAFSLFASTQKSRFRLKEKYPNRYKIIKEMIASL